MSNHITVPSKPKRSFLPQDFKVENWEGLVSYFQDLEKRDINSLEDLRHWFQDRSELEAVLSEDAGWRYINMTCYTDNEEYSKAYQNF